MRTIASSIPQLELFLRGPSFVRKSRDFASTETPAFPRSARNLGFDSAAIGIGFDDRYEGRGALREKRFEFEVVPREKLEEFSGFLPPLEKERQQQRASARQGGGGSSASASFRLSRA